MKIAILGAGSLGMIHGALMQRGGYDVTLIDVIPEHVEALNMHGARITGLYDAVIPVKASLPQDAEGVFDYILLHTKQMHMLNALSSISRHISEETIIVTLENGIPEYKVADVYGADRVMGGTVFHGARYVGPGVSELTTDYDVMHIYIGELNGKETDRIKQLKQMMESICEIEITKDIMAIKWTKLIMNAALSGMSASLGSTFGEVSENEDGMMAMIKLCQEGAAVMAAKNLYPIDMEGFLPTVENFSYKNKEELDRIRGELKALIKLSYNEIASMLQDIRMGRTACEINEINGEIVKAGKELGFETPYNNEIVNLVTRIINKELSADFSNIKYFEALNEKNA